MSKFCRHLPGHVILLLIVIVCSSLSGSAQSINIVNSLDTTPGVTVTQPAALTLRLERNENQPSLPSNTPASATATKNGYRIEVFADNNRAAKNEAANRKARLQARFPQYRAYQLFESPFWRVRVGDFRSRNEAQEVMDEIKRAFPSYSPFLRVVRDRIN